MSYQQDWVMRQIEMMSQFVARLLFGRDQVEYRVVAPGAPTAADRLSQELTALLDRGDYARAAALLGDRAAAAGDLAHLRLGLSFFSALNARDDEALAAGGYSRDAALADFQRLLECYHIPTASL